MLDVIAQTHPLRWSQFDAREMPAGSTLAEIVSALDLDPRFGEPVVTLTRGTHAWRVDASLWRVVRPTEGTRIDVGYRVQGTVALAALAAAAGPASAVAGWVAAGGLGYTLAVAAINVVAGLALSALITPPPQDFETPTGTQRGYTISGTRNRANKYGAVPKVLGRHRFAPPPSAEGRAVYQYDRAAYRMRFCLGWGPLAIEDIRIGDTPLWHFRGVYVDFFNVDYASTISLFPYAAGWNVSWFYGASPGRLYANDFSTEAIGADLSLYSPQSRTTAPNSWRATVQISFPQGLRYIKDEGDTRAIGVTFHVRYRAVGTTPWALGAEVYVRNETASPLYIERDVFFPAAGQYEVQIERVWQNDEGPEDQHVYDATWDALVSSQESATGTSLLSHPGVAEMTLEVAASEQLSGVLDNVNVTAWQMAPTWNAQTGWSAPQITRNPAWIYLDMIRGQHLKRPVPDEQIDLNAFAIWAWEKGAMTCDYVVDSQQRLGDVLDVIAPTGLARRGYRDGLHSIIREPTDYTPRQVITPRNSWGFRSELDMTRELHGVRAQYIDPRRDWTQQEVTVYLGGYNASNATNIETLQLPGVVDDTGGTWRVKLIARYYLEAAARRRETFRVTMDIEHMAIQRGDVVELVNDAASVGVASARVQSVTPTEITPDDAHNLVAATGYLLRVRKSDGTVADIAGTWGGSVFALWTGQSSAGVQVGDLMSVYEWAEERQLCVVTSILPDQAGNAEVVMKPLAPGIGGFRNHALAPFKPVVGNLPSPMDPAIPERPKLNFMASDERSVMDDGRTPRIGVRLDVPNRLFPQPTVDRLQLRWRLRGDDEWTLGEQVFTSQPWVLTGPVALGEEYAVEARIERIGVVSGWESFGTVKAQAHRDPPRDVEDLTVSGTGQQLTLRWRPEGRRDTAALVIRHSVKEDATWDEASEIARVPWPAETAQVPSLVGRFLAKWINVDGRYSANADTVEVAIEDLTDYHEMAVYTLVAPNMSVAQHFNDPVRLPGVGFANISTLSGNLTLKPTLTGEFAQAGGIEVDQPADFIFDDQYDVEVFQKVTYRGTQGLQHVNGGTLKDETMPARRYVADTGVSSRVSAFPVVYRNPFMDDNYWSTAPKAASGYAVRVAKARQIAVAIQMRGGPEIDNTYSPLVTEIYISIRLPRMVKQGEVTVSAVATFEPVEFDFVASGRFGTMPTVTAALVGGAPGDTVMIDSVDYGGFGVRVTDSSGNPKAGTVQWTATGFGRKAAA